MGRRNYRISLALGGGGARGLAHIGVIQVLEEEGIPINAIAGTSVGSVVGAHYSLWKDIKRLKITAVEFANKMNQYSKYFDFNKLQEEDDNQQKMPWRKLTEIMKKGYLFHTEINKICLNDGMMMEKLLEEIFGEHDFCETKIPFFAIAADLISGRQVILNKGNLTKGIMASCAIPGIFPPVTYNKKQLLVDGGIIDNVPVEPLRKMGADFIIASDINRELKRKGNYKNGIDILIRSELITSKALRRIQLEKSDFVIFPEINNIDWWNFSKPEQCIKIGVDATSQKIDQLKKLLRKSKIKTKWKNLLIKH